MNWSRNVAEYLVDFASAVATGSLRAAMEALPLDRSAQLDVVLRLAGMLLHRSNVRPRFVECVHAFTTGIGNGSSATLESLTEHYASAHDRCYAPFFGRHPHILENYLANTILRCRFPFGKEGAKTTMERECALLTAQFALIKGFLIGVAGFHREAFSAEHVVHTVQATSKHFEHHPEFLDLAYELLRESQMEGASGTGDPAPECGASRPQTTFAGDIRSGTAVRELGLLASLAPPPSPCQPRHHSQLAQHLLERARRGAPEDGSGLESVVGDGLAAEHAGLAAENDAGADMRVVADAHLAGEHRAVAHRAGAADAHPRDQNHVFANLAVVADVDQVIHLGSAANLCLLQRAAIDGRVGADLNVVFDEQRALLRKLGVRAGEPRRARSRSRPRPAPLQRGR